MSTLNLTIDDDDDNSKQSKQDAQSLLEKGDSYREQVTRGEIKKKIFDVRRKPAMDEATADQLIQTMDSRTYHDMINDISLLLISNIDPVNSEQAKAWYTKYEKNNPQMNLVWIKTINALKQLFNTDPNLLKNNFTTQVLAIRKNSEQAIQLQKKYFDEQQKSYQLVTQLNDMKKDPNGEIYRRHYNKLCKDNPSLLGSSLRAEEALLELKESNSANLYNNLSKLLNEQSLAIHNVSQEDAKLDKYTTLTQQQPILENIQKYEAIRDKLGIQVEEINQQGIKLDAEILDSQIKIQVIKDLQSKTPSQFVTQHQKANEQLALTKENIQRFNATANQQGMIIEHDDSASQAGSKPKHDPPSINAQFIQQLLGVDIKDKNLSSLQNEFRSHNNEMNQVYQLLSKAFYREQSLIGQSQVSDNQSKFSQQKSKINQINEEIQFIDLQKQELEAEDLKKQKKQELEEVTEQQETAKELTQNKHYTYVWDNYKITKDDWQDIMGQILPQHPETSKINNKVNYICFVANGSFNGVTKLGKIFKQNPSLWNTIQQEIHSYVKKLTDDRNKSKQINEEFHNQQKKPTINIIYDNPNWSVPQSKIQDNYEIRNELFEKPQISNKHLFNVNLKQDTKKQEIFADDYAKKSFQQQITDANDFSSIGEIEQFIYIAFNNQTISKDTLKLLQEQMITKRKLLRPKGKPLSQQINQNNKDQIDEELPNHPSNIKSISANDQLAQQMQNFLKQFSAIAQGQMLNYNADEKYSRPQPPGTSLERQILKKQYRSNTPPQHNNNTEKLIDKLIQLQLINNLKNNNSNNRQDYQKGYSIHMHNDANRDSSRQSRFQSSRNSSRYNSNNSKRSASISSKRNSYSSKRKNNYKKQKRKPKKSFSRNSSKSSNGSKKNVKVKPKYKKQTRSQSKSRSNSNHKFIRKPSYQRKQSQLGKQPKSKSPKSILKKPLGKGYRKSKSKSSKRSVSFSRNKSQKTYKNKRKSTQKQYFNQNKFQIKNQKKNYKNGIKTKSNKSIDYFQQTAKQMNYTPGKKQCKFGAYCVTYNCQFLHKEYKVCQILLQTVNRSLNWCIPIAIQNLNLKLRDFNSTLLLRVLQIGQKIRIEYDIGQEQKLKEFFTTGEYKLDIQSGSQILNVDFIVNFVDNIGRWKTQPLITGGPQLRIQGVKQQVVIQSSFTNKLPILNNMFNILVQIIVDMSKRNTLPQDFKNINTIHYEKWAYHQKTSQTKGLAQSYYVEYYDTYFKKQLRIYINDNDLVFKMVQNGITQIKLYQQNYYKIVKLKSEGLYPNHEIMDLLKMMEEDKNRVTDTHIPIFEQYDTINDSQRLDIFKHIEQIFDENAKNFIEDIAIKAQNMEKQVVNNIKADVIKKHANLAFSQFNSANVIISHSTSALNECNIFPYFHYKKYYEELAYKFCLYLIQLEQTASDQNIIDDIHTLYTIYIKAISLKVNHTTFHNQLNQWLQSCQTGYQKFYMQKVDEQGYIALNKLKFFLNNKKKNSDQSSQSQQSQQQQQQSQQNDQKSGMEFEDIPNGSNKSSQEHNESDNIMTLQKAQEQAFLLFLSNSTIIYQVVDRFVSTSSLEPQEAASIYEYFKKAKWKKISSNILNSIRTFMSKDDQIQFDIINSYLQNIN